MSTLSEYGGEGGTKALSDCWVGFPQDCLSPLSMQALPAPSESLCIVEMGGTEAKEETGEAGVQGGLYLNIGLQVIH